MGTAFPWSWCSPDQLPPSTNPASQMPNLIRPQDLLVTFEPDGRVLIKSASRAAAVKAPPWAVGVLAVCSRPCTRDQVVAAMGPNAGGVYDALADAGLLVAPEVAMDTPVMFHNYAGIEVHRRMLIDEPRMAGYWAGLKATIRPGDVVIDAGSGTGVLATMAALCGAARVYALEQSDFADTIPAVAEASGVGDRVTVVRGDFSKVVLPEKARVLVTETFGAWAYAEDPIPDVARCIANNLADDGVVVPGRVRLWAAPMPVAPLSLLHPFRRRPDGVNLTPLLADARCRGHITPVAADAVGPASLIADVPFPGTAPWAFSGTLTVDSPCEAVCCWYDLEMAPGVILPTGPADPMTHWKQSVLPFALDPGEYTIELLPAPEDRRSLLIRIGTHEIRLR
jgi:hypothetical protein